VVRFSKDASRVAARSIQGVLRIQSAGECNEFCLYDHPTNLREFASAIRYLLKNFELRLRMGLMDLMP
jgi:hypothetical protein